MSKIENILLSRFKNANPYDFPKIDVILHNPVMDVVLSTVTILDVTRNFNSDITDIINIEFLMPIGDYREYIDAHEDELEITITFTYTDKRKENIRHKFIPDNEIIDKYNSLYRNKDVNLLNTQDMFLVKGQLIDPLVILLKSKYITGIFNNKTLKDILNYYFSKKMDEVLLLGSKLKFQTFITEPDNSKSYLNIPIKPFTKLIKLPYHLQNDIYGVYDGGIGTYFTQLGSRFFNDSKINNNFYNIFVYPLYSDTKYKKDYGKIPVLDILNPTIPYTAYNDLNYTYGNGIFTVTVDKVTFSSDKDKYKEPTSFIDINEYGTFDKPNVDNVKYVSEIAKTLKYYNSGVTKALDNIVPIDMDANKKVYTTRVNRFNGIFGTFDLNRALPDFIYPGMSFRYMFEDNGKVIDTYGIIHAITYTYDFTNNNINAKVLGWFKKI